MSLSTLIICTKDRPVELEACLDSIASCVYYPGEILVVDSSAHALSQLVVERFARTKLPQVSFRKTSSGLTRQRNFGIAFIDDRSEIVHFLDDDVVVDGNYFTEIEAGIVSDPSVIGAGGCVTNVPQHGRLFVKSRVRREGLVGSDGVNHLSRSRGEGVRNVHWLSGCSMSFRASVFEHVRFDERRTGNGVGEDVDFCLRASAFGRILWLPKATLEHHQSPINRFGARKSGFSTIDHRLLLATDRLHTVRRSRVMARGYVESLMRLLRSFVTGSESQREYALGMLERLGRGSDD